LLERAPAFNFPPFIATLALGAKLHLGVVVGEMLLGFGVLLLVAFFAAPSAAAYEVSADMITKDGDQK
jgi:hypothetical protein